MILRTPPNPLGDWPLLGWTLPSAPATAASNASVIAPLGSPVLNHPFSMARTMWESNALGNEWACCFAEVFSVSDTINSLLVTLPPLTRGTSRAVDCLPNASFLLERSSYMNNRVLWPMGRVTWSQGEKSSDDVHSEEKVSSLSSTSLPLPSLHPLLETDRRLLCPRQLAE